MQREYLRFFLRKQEGYYSFYKVAHSLPKSISHFIMRKCKTSTSRYENRASRSGDSNEKLELANVKLAKVEVDNGFYHLLVNRKK